MHPHKWILNILPWQINFKLDVLHPTIIDFTQGSATLARDGGHPVFCSHRLMIDPSRLNLYRFRKNRIIWTPQT